LLNESRTPRKLPSFNAPFLSASEQAEVVRIAETKVARSGRRRTRILIGALTTVIVLGLLAYWNERSLREYYYWVAYVRGYVLTAQDERMLKPGDTFAECVKTDGDYSKYCPQMVVVPAGKFTMGSPATEEGHVGEEGPQHEVTIVRPFAVSKFEVTFDQWETCVEYGGCLRIRTAGTTFGGGKQPASGVSWHDAQEYVQWLSGLTGQSYRLLTEAEWEYAARAGSTGPYSFEGDASVLGEYAWYSENSGGTTHPVGEKKPNVFGLYDVHGNVGEWVEDCYHENYNEYPTDGAAWATDGCSYRVVRGGSWFYVPQDLRSASRGGVQTDVRNDTLGFRVGRTLAP
jgi:formylglycine-generating enzyme required for sulfatase activity